MAVTVLKHCKESPSWKPKHLSNAIKYILDVKHGEEKTDFGKWVGGNAGTGDSEILDTFLNTKKDYGKETGRQGYHFVISFPPGEVDAQTCYNIMQDFCQEYLGDSYDYVFAVHTDQEHMHGHIIFNSVSRKTGYKYHYKKGDWEKSIQPITDKICKAYGVAPLTFEKEKKGKSYAQWAEEKKGDVSWKRVMRADIDFATEKASDMEEFFEMMEEAGYTIKFNPRSYSTRTKAPYITYIYTEKNGIQHKHRSLALFGGDKDMYNLSSIAEKIRLKNLEEPHYKELTDDMEKKMNIRLGQVSTTVKNTKTYWRMYQAVSFYKLPNPFAVPQKDVRRDMVRIEKLIEECAYLKKQQSISIHALSKRMDEVEEELKNYYILRKSLKAVDENVKDTILPADTAQYRQLSKKLSQMDDTDDRWEEIYDEMEELEVELPSVWIENEKRLQHCEQSIKILKKEKQILGRIISTEGGREIAKEMKPEMVPGLK